MYGWYVIQTFATAEARVKQELERRAKEGRLPSLRQVVIPAEPVERVEGGRKVTQLRRTMPGYVLVNMEPDELTVKRLRATNGVIGFAGGDLRRPVPLTKPEVDKMLHHGGTTDRPRIVLDIEIGDDVDIAEGPFEGFTGKVAEINEDGAKLKVLAEVFGQPTPIEVSFDQLKVAA
jgi:transcriptional antiterminator NusG